MHIERYTWEYGVHQNFPDAREVRAGCGESVYAAEEGGRFYLIYYRSMLADFICPAQPGIEEPNWVEVIAFDDHESRAQYLRERWPNKRLESY